MSKSVILYPNNRSSKSIDKTTNNPNNDIILKETFPICFDNSEMSPSAVKLTRFIN